MPKSKDDEWIRTGFEQPVDHLCRFGPTAPVVIGGLSNGSPRFEVLAQIDTGAAGTGISPAIAKKLGIDPFDTGSIHEAGREPVVASLFKVRIEIPRVMDIELDVAGLPSLGKPHDVLIGRDILERFRLVVDFTNGVTQLHFKKDA